MATQTVLLALAVTLGGFAAGPSTLIPSPSATQAAPAPPAPAAADADADGASLLTFDHIFARPVAHEYPKELAWSPDSARLAYLMPGDNDQDVLWALDIATMERSVLLSSADLPPLASADRGDSGDSGEDDEDGEEAKERAIDGYRFTPSGALLVESGEELLWVETGKTVRRLAGKEKALAAPEHSRLSPDGQRLSYVRGQDLYLLDVASGKERALTSDGVENEILNGQTDWVYWEEIFNRTSEGHWWSPDSHQLAYYRFDDRAVATYTLLDFSGQYPEPIAQRYPKAGTTNPTVQVGVIDVSKPGSSTVWLDTAPAGAAAGSPEADVYLARVTWLPDSQHVAVQRLNREQNRLDLLRCAIADGSCEVLLTDEHATWINLGDELTFLKDGRFLWGSEESGWRHLYLYAADGSRIRPVTQGLWSVTGLERVDEEAGKVFFTAPPTPSAGYFHRMVWEASLGAEMSFKPLTHTAGWHTALFAPDGRHWVHGRSTSERLPVRELMGPSNETLSELISEPAPEFDVQQLPAYEYLFIWGLDGNRLPARVLKPANFDASKKYPVIMYHYGGPGSQVVANRWGGPRDLWHKRMAQRGYIVFSVDSASSVFFGKRGEDKDHRLFGPTNVIAQEAGVEYLKTLPYVDASRIGIWGWSGGGANTLNVMLTKPGLWAAGVAGAPVTDWSFYDSIWTERYLDSPQDNPEGYKASPISIAANLKDPLLIVHGTSDDNVHPQNTLMMSKAFIDANVPFEQAIYPGQKHGFRGKASRHFYERMEGFFDRWLAEP